MLGEQGYNIAEGEEGESEVNVKIDSAGDSRGVAQHEILPCSDVVGLQPETIDRWGAVRRSGRSVVSAKDVHHSAERWKFRVEWLAGGKKSATAFLSYNTSLVTSHSS